MEIQSPLQSVELPEEHHHQTHHYCYCYCRNPNMTKMFVAYYILLTLIAFSLPSLYTSSAPDVCDRDSVDAAARIQFKDGVEKTFIASGGNYWLVDEATERPDVNTSLTIPFDFIPDVAIVKDTRECSRGGLFLLLIEYRLDRLSGTGTWLLLEGRIERLSSSIPIDWNTVSELAVCEADLKSCVIKNNYFMMARFDFKKKLDAAFGVIGKVAYFIQGTKMSKAVYQRQCVSDNPARDVIGYDAVEIPTSQVTAALSIGDRENVTIILFDNDIHVNLTKTDLETITFIPEELYLRDWYANSPHFFKLCPGSSSFSAFIFSDLFSWGSKRHNFAKTILFLVIGSLVLAIIVGIVLLLVFLKFRRFRRSIRAGDRDVVVASVELETTPMTGSEEKITTINGNENEKKLLQTSC